MQESQENHIRSLAQNPHRGPQRWFRETPDGIVSRSMVWLGCLLAVGVVAVLVLGLTVSPKRGPIWVPLTVGGGFVVGGVLFAIARYSFELNWTSRTWRETRGVLWWTKDRQGTFDDVTALVLSEHRRPVFTRPPRVWVIGIALRDRPVLMDVFLISSRDQAQEKFHALVHKMRVPALDLSAR